MTINTRYGTLILAISITLNGCGSGNDSEPGSTNGSDLTPPEVSAVTPADGATDVDRHTAVSVTFNEDILPTSITNNGVTLASNGGTIAGSVSFDGVSNTATFAAEDKLPLLSKVTASATTAITDLSGNPLAQAHSWSFTTLDGQWQGATPLDTGLGYATYPQVALDAAGNAQLVWVHYDGANDSVFSNRFNAAENRWEGVTAINADGGDAMHPTVAVNPAGDAIVVWHQIYSAARVYGKVYSAAAGRWLDTAGLDTTGGPTDRPAVAIDPAGNALAVWSQDDGFTQRPYGNRYNAAEARWEGAVALDSGNGYSFFTDVAMDPAGNALVVWMQWDGSVSNIYGNRYPATEGRWEGAVLLEADNINTTYPQVALDTSGNAMVVWARNDNANSNVYGRRYDSNNGTWGTVVELATSPGNDPHPQVAMASSGNALVTWVQNDYARSNVLGRHFNAEHDRWGEPVEIGTSLPIQPSPQLAMDATGNAVVAWKRYAGDGTISIYSNRFNAISDHWEGMIALESTSEETLSPSVTLNSRGEAMVVWAQDTGTGYDAYGNRFE